MAEPTQFVFSHKEVVEALVKQQGIHEGIWGLHVTFGMQVMNIGEEPSGITPAAIIPLLSIGLQKFQEETSISVDAGKINPQEG